MKKNRYQIHFVYKCGARSFELYHDLLSDEISERVLSVVRSMFSRILRIGSFSVDVADVPEDVQLFQPSFSSYNAVQAMSYDLLNLVASSCYGK